MKEILEKNIDFYDVNSSFTNNDLWCGSLGAERDKQIGKDGGGMDKTCRILCLFHIFYTCKIVSFDVINEGMAQYGFETSRKTIERDVLLLKRAGILQVYYSQKEKAYIPADGDIMHGFCVNQHGFSPLKLPENKNQRMYMERIIRLCTVMVDVIIGEIKDPIGWYHSNYPNLSDRTRQRDFKLLQKVGYCMTYEPEDEFSPGGYYYDYPGRYLGPPEWLREQQREELLKTLLADTEEEYG